MIAQRRRYPVLKAMTSIALDASQSERGKTRAEATSSICDQWESQTDLVGAGLTPGIKIEVTPNTGTGKRTRKVLWQPLDLRSRLFGYYEVIARRCVRC